MATNAGQQDKSTPLLAFCEGNTSPDFPRKRPTMRKAYPFHIIILENYGLPSRVAFCHITTRTCIYLPSSPSNTFALLIKGIIRKLVILNNISNNSPLSCKLWTMWHRITVQRFKYITLLVSDVRKANNWFVATLCFWFRKLCWL